MGKQSIAGWALMGMALALAGCLVEEQQSDLRGVRASAIANFEQVEWRPELDGDDWRFAQPEPIVDPCDCSNESCLQDWVSEGFGCDVCVALTCGDEHNHVCNSCE